MGIFRAPNSFFQNSQSNCGVGPAELTTGVVAWRKEKPEAQMLLPVPHEYSNSFCSWQLLWYTLALFQDPPPPFPVDSHHLSFISCSGASFSVSPRRDVLTFCSVCSLCWGGWQHFWFGLGREVGERQCDSSQLLEEGSLSSPSGLRLNVWTMCSLSFLVGLVQLSNSYWLRWPLGQSVAVWHSWGLLSALGHLQPSASSAGWGWVFCQVSDIFNSCFCELCALLLLLCANGPSSRFPALPFRWSLSPSLWQWAPQTLEKESGKAWGSVGGSFGIKGG